jgi:hypothetical protein
MRKFTATVMICLWAAALASAQGAARLSEMRASRGVDPKLQSPVGVSETFGPEARPIYLSVKLADAPQGTQVKITAYFLANGQPQQIAVQEFPDVYGTGYLSFKITPPASGWFIGRYQAVFQLNRKDQGSIVFTVAAARAAAPPSPAYRTFSSPDYGFSIQYPAGWVEGEKGKPSVVCMFLANAKNSPVSSLNVQVVPVTGAGDSLGKEAINLVAQQLIDQITGALKGRLRNDTWTTAGLLTGRELDSEYDYQGARIRQRQFLTYRASKVFILILTADERVYGSVAGYYLNAAKTLQFYAK